MATWRRIRRGTALRETQRRQERRQRSQTLTSTCTMASPPAAEGQGTALDCVPAMAERCATDYLEQVEKRV